MSTSAYCISIFSQCHYSFLNPSIQQLQQPQVPHFVLEEVLTVMCTETIVHFLEDEKVLKLCASSGDDLARLRAGVGELLGWERPGWEVWENLNDRLVARRDTEP